ncbi:MAG: DMT family transporter [Caldilineaceae bacterium]|nr:DMT family transporter [Caldilineaceae bacterium]
MQRLDTLLLLILGAVWGASYLFMRIAAPVLGPISLMAARVALAALALWIYCIAFSSRPDWRKRWRQFLFLGLFNNAVPFTLIAVAVIHLNASIAAILNATTPLFTAMISAMWLGEALGVRRFGGIVLGIGGVVILMGWSPLPLTARTLLAGGAALLAAVSYGLAAVYARSRFRDVPPEHTAVGQLTGATLILTPVAFLQPPEEPISIAVAAAVLALALVCTSFAYLIYFRLIASAGATQAATVTFLVPFFSVLWGVLLLGEPLSAGMLLGLVVILFSIWLVLGYGSQRFRKTLAARAAVRNTRPR